MKHDTIGSCTEKVRSWNPMRAAAQQEITYIDLGAVDNDLKSIVAPQRVLGCDAPSRARQLVNSGDILVSTVRPYLNGVAQVSNELDGATASTGFCVVRPNHEKVDASYLFHWLRTPAFIAEMVRQSTGASYPAVSDRIILQSLMPLPPLFEQQRIALILDQAAALQRLRQRVVSRLGQLGQAIFREMFGDVITNERNFPSGTVGDLVLGFDSGKNLAPAPGNEITANRVLKVSSVTSGTFDETESKPLPDEYKPPANHFVKRGDLLFSRANTAALIGATALVMGVASNIVLPDKIWRFIWRERNEAIFTHALFQSPAMRREISRRASGTSGSMKNIGKEKVLNIAIGIPGANCRREFERRMEGCNAMLADAVSASHAADALFISLQHRAFNGEL